MSQPPIQASHEDEPRERPPESRAARLEPSAGDVLFADVTPQPAPSMNVASHGAPVRSESRVMLVAGVVAVGVASFAAGFGGGFIVGERSTPSTESMRVSRHEPVAQPQPTHAAVEDPNPLASTTQTVASIPDRQVSTSEPIVEPVVSPSDHDTTRERPTSKERRPPRSVDNEVRPASVPVPPDTVATASTGSLQVVSRPSGARVFVDDDLIGTTPLLLSDVAAGSKQLRIELSGYKTWTTPVQIKPSARARVSAGLEP